VIDPKTRKAFIYRLGEPRLAVPSNGSLAAEKIIPGFKLSLKELFAALR
jgi:hypothetical protein